MSYDISSRDYLRRALVQIETGTPDSLFYAAFELRCGIQARMQQYLSAWDHIEKKIQQGWQLDKLGKDIEKYFNKRDTYVRLGIHNRADDSPIYVAYYTPITSRLERAGGRLGDHLHAMKRWRGDDDAWWQETREYLRQIAEMLRIANLGTLLGPPLKKGNRSGSVCMEFPPDYDADRIKNMVGAEILMHVSHLDSYPEELEPEAIVWNI